jgi:5-formyltetrahydrofolate cyclo-ligase
MELPTNGAKKKSLRQSFRVDRKFLVQPVTWNHLIDSIEFKSATMIASYISYGDEPDTNGLNQTILESGKTLLLPRMRSDNFLDWVIWKGKIETLKTNKNIMEPIGDAIAPERIKNIDFVILPALHVDHSGNRLGQGGGYYDRALSLITGFKVALIYQGELTSIELPQEVHDQTLDAAATPEILVRFSKKIN